MKWLLLLLVSINVVLFVVQMKGKDNESVMYEYKKISGVKDIDLLHESRSEIIKEGDRCVVIGEISEQKSLSDLTDFLAANDIQFDLIEREENMAPYYWVYVQEGGERLSEVLQKKKIESFVVGAGEFKGVISLGLFENIDLAKDLLLSLKKEDIDAKIRERNKSKMTRWISFSQEQLEKKTDLINELKVKQLNVGEIKEFFCKSIASEK